MNLDELLAAIEKKDVATAGQISAIRAEVGKLVDKTTALSIMGPGVGSNPQARNKAISAFGAWAGKADYTPTQELMTAGMSVGSDPDGGYTVLPEVDSAINGLLLPISPMRRIARVVQTNSSAFKTLQTTTQPDGGWTGELDARPVGNGPKLAEITVPASEQYSNIPISQSLLDDSAFDIGAFVVGEISKSFALREGTAFISGDGVNKPRGLLTYTTSSADDSSRAFGTIQYIPSGTSADLGTVPTDTLNTAIFALSAPYRSLGATWLFNSKTASVLSKLKDTTGRPLWTQSLQAGLPSTLCGFGVEVDENMPDIGANAFPIAFGAFKSAYLVTDRFGTRVLRDPYTSKPNVLLYATKRTGGGLQDSRAAKLIRCSVS